MLDEYYVLHPTLGEVLLCAEKCIHAEKSPGMCQPELVETLLCVDLVWMSSYDGGGGGRATMCLISS